MEDRDQIEQFPRSQNKHAPDQLEDTHRYQLVSVIMMCSEANSRQRWKKV
jgi:hypothetical protein